MIARELHKHKHYYALLIIGEAILLGLFVTLNTSSVRMFIAFLVGIAYFLWGTVTHKGEVRTLRLVLEYAFIGLLATVILIAIINNL